MMNNLSEYATSLKTRAAETYTGYTSKDEIEQALLEATSDNATQLSNTALLVLADATNGSEGGRIMDHFLEKLKCAAFEWKRIAKALNAIEFMIKNGNPGLVGKVQMQGGSTIIGL